MDRLILEAHGRGYFIADPDGRRLRRLADSGQPIPDKLLPGRMIMQLSQDERTLLATVTAKDFNRRLFGG